MDRGAWWATAHGVTRSQTQLKQLSTHTACMCVLSYSVESDSLQPHRLQPARLLYPWNSPGKNTTVGSHSPLQGFFLTQGSNLGLLHCRQILYHLSHQGNLLYLLGWQKSLFGFFHVDMEKPKQSLWLTQHLPQG